MGDTVAALGYKTDVPTRTRDTIRKRKDQLLGRADERKDQLLGRADEATPDGQEIRRKASRAASIVQENPAGVAIGAMAVGFLVGTLVPSSRVEDEKVGPIADDVKGQARETAEEAFERGRDVAQQAVQSAADTVREQGQDQAAELRDSAQERASHVQDGAQAHAQRQM